MLGPLVLRAGLCLWGAEHDSSEELSSSYLPVVQTEVVSSTGSHLPALLATGPINAVGRKREMLKSEGETAKLGQKGASRQELLDSHLFHPQKCQNFQDRPASTTPYTQHNILSNYQTPHFRFHLKMNEAKHPLPGPLQKTLGTGAACKSISPTILVWPYFMARVRAVAPVLSRTSAFTPCRKNTCLSAHGRGQYRKYICTLKKPPRIVLAPPSAIQAHL